MKFIQARNYTPVTAGRAIDVLVIHDMESPEAQDTAENVARWFAGPTAPQASAHYCIDSDSIVQCVLNKDVAWHAPPCNHNGIGLEHAGRAAQNRAQWLDGYGWKMLRRSAKLSRRLCRRYGLPMRFVSSEGLKAGRRGLTGHAQVSDAFHRTNHRDPGTHFPWDIYLRLVNHPVRTYVAYHLKRRHGIPYTEKA